jgi:hypothetical protein
MPLRGRDGVHVNGAQAVGHIGRGPAGARIARDQHHRQVVVAGPAARGGGDAVKAGQQPFALRPDPRRLAHEDAAKLAHPARRAKAGAAIGRDAGHDLAQVLAAAGLAGVEQPDRAIGCGEQHRVLFRPVRRVRHLHRRQPALALQRGHPDRDVAHPLHRAAEPDAGQPAIGQQGQVRGMVLDAGRRQEGAQPSIGAGAQAPVHLGGDSGRGKVRRFRRFAWAIPGCWVV